MPLHPNTQNLASATHGSPDIAPVELQDVLTERQGGVGVHKPDEKELSEDKKRRKGGRGSACFDASLKGKR